jgi:hypothetical protein
MLSSIMPVMGCDHFTHDFIHPLYTFTMTSNPSANRAPLVELCPFRGSGTPCAHA